MKAIEIGTILTFRELIQNGIDSKANIVNGMPWSWRINGKTITHENDHCYLIEAITGSEKFYPDYSLKIVEHGLHVLKSFPYDTHAPNGCPM